MAITGDWNYQGGGDRKSYYHQFRDSRSRHEQLRPTRSQLGVPKSREDAMTDVIFNPRTFTSNLLHNLEYFFIGRYAGLAGYFFPGMFAMLALLAAPRRRPGWQWLVLAAALAQGLIFVIGTPYTWSGGGVGNRYFFAGYGVMLFLLPPIESLGAGVRAVGDRRLVRRADGAEPVRRVVQAEREREGGAAADVSGGADAAERPAGLHGAGARARSWFGGLGQGDSGLPRHVP